MTNKCEICKNKEICKYRKEYEARFKELAELDESKIRENPTFSIDLDCRYYDEAKEQTKTITGTGTYPYTLTDECPCNNCSNKSLTGSCTCFNYTQWLSRKYGRDYKLNGVSTHPCEGCLIYEKAKNGEFVVGDQCTYCQNSPTKVTCTCGDTVGSLRNQSICKL